METNSFPISLPQLGNFEPVPLPRSVNPSNFKEILDEIALETLSPRTPGWTPPTTRNTTQSRFFRDSVINCHNALTKFGEGDSGINYQVAFMAPSFNLALISCITRSLFSDSKVLTKYKELLPFDINRETLIQLRKSARNSAPPIIILKDLWSFTQMAQAIKHLHPSLVPQSLPPFVYDQTDPATGESILFRPQDVSFLESMISFAQAVRVNLDPSGLKSNVVLAEPINPRKGVLVLPRSDNEYHQELYNQDSDGLVFRYYNLDRIFVRIGRNSYEQKGAKKNWYSKTSLQNFGRYFSV